MTTRPGRSMSGTLRTQIGCTKGRIIKWIEKFRALQRDHPKSNPNATTAVCEEVLEEIKECKERLKDNMASLLDYHKEWKLLYREDEEERQIWQNYVDTYGDYMQTYEEAKDIVEELNSMHSRWAKVLRSKSSSGDSEQNTLRSVTPAGETFLTKEQKQALDDHFTPPAPPISPGISTPTHFDSHHPVPPMPGFYTPTAISMPLLEPIKLKTFAGNIVEWPEFKEIFLAMVGNQPLEPIVKFHRLLNCLRGNALNAIRGIHVTGANYDIACRRLEEEFGNIHAIKHKLRSNFLSFRVRTATLEETHVSYIEMMQLYAQLDNCGESVKDVMYAQIIESKFPKFIMDKVFSRTDGVTPTTDVLLNLIGKIIKLQLQIERNYDDNNPFAPAQLNNLRQHKPPRQSNQDVLDLPTTPSPPRTRESGTTQPRRSISCLYCGASEHVSFQCRMKIADKKAILQEKRCCFNCLRRGHSAKECRRRHCYHCEERHHSSICPKNQVTATSKTSHEARPTTQKIPVVEKSKPSQKADSFPVRRTYPAQKPNTHMSVEETQVDSVCEEETENSYGIVESAMHVNTPENNIVVHNQQRPEENTNKTVLMMCADVIIDHPESPWNGSHVTAFLDSGSSRTYIWKQTAETLDLPVLKNERLRINVFGQQEPVTVDGQMVSFTLHLNDGERINVVATTMDQPVSKMNQAQFRPELLAKLRAESLLQIPCATVNPVLLIGADYFWQLCEGTIPMSLPSGFTLLNTRIGKILTGAGNLKTHSLPSVFMALDDILEDAPELEETTLLGLHDCLDGHKSEDLVPDPSYAHLSDLLQKFSSLEAMGIMDDPLSNDDMEAQKIFESTIRYTEDGRYQVGWPWKSPSEPCLFSNYALCLRRLKSVVDMLKRRDPEFTKPGDRSLLERYDDALQEYLRLGIIEKVDINKMPDSSLIHYIPHHPVLTEKKLRIVGDASSKMKGSKSLNECLHRGPVRLPLIGQVLLRWRLYPIAIISDLEKAFLQVELREPDREATRFLWIKNLDQEVTPTNIQIYRFTRVPFGVISSPFLLSGTIHHHLTNSNCPLSKEILENLYVDNVLLGADNVEEAIVKFHVSKEIFAEAAMNLRDFVSNSAALNNYFRAQQEDPPPTIKMLGIPWNTVTDTLSYRLSEFNHLRCTKKTILSFTASLFDPLGHLAPLLVPLKLFLQNLWKEHLNWSDELPPELAAKWRSILRDWSPVSFKLNRCIPMDKTKPMELHAFVDASGYAYGSCIYLRYVNKDTDKLETALLFAKSRLAPKDKMTIPRLELMACLVGVRALKFVHESLKLAISEHFLWTDSSCVLGWIRSGKDQAVFVQNRLNEILNAPFSIVFQHVGTKINPADILSRGCTPSELKEYALWFNGPPFLLKSTLEIDTDLHNSIQTTLMAVEDSYPVVDQPQKILPPLVPLESVSSFSKLRTVYMMLMFFMIAKMITATSKIRLLQQFIPRLKSCPPVTSFWEFRNWIGRRIDLALIRQAQKTHPPDLKTIRLYNLEYDSRDELWRIKSRTDSIRSEMLIYLPRASLITRLWILHCHEQLSHASYTTTLAKFRTNFWSPKARSLVKSTIHHYCYKCRRHSAKPFALPEMPELPWTRMTPSRPFTHLGLDYIGPFLYRAEDNLAKKVWVLLFTCMASRAIHCEATTSLSTQHFVLALRRFVSRRGVPTSILSDNASQLVLTKSLLKEDIFKGTSLESVIWKTTVAEAPWQGGVYERLVGLFKTSFKTIAGKRMLSLEEFTTLMTESEATVNSRPLTYLAEDQEFSLIRPLDILIPGIGEDPFAISSELEDISQDPDYRIRLSSQDTIQAALLASIRRANDFWILWRRHYLSALHDSLATEHRNPRSTADAIHPQIGDIVVIGDKTLPRTQWRLGKIVDLPTTTPIRSATVMLPNRSQIERPLNSLYPMEIRSTTSSQLTLPAPQPSQDPPRRSARVQNLPRPNYLYFISLLCLIATVTADINDVQRPFPTNCTSCELNCTARTMKFTSEESGFLHFLCLSNEDVGKRCVNTTELSEYIFPEEFVIVKKILTLFSYKDGALVYHAEMTCPRESICTAPSCTFCLDYGSYYWTCTSRKIFILEVSFLWIILIGIFSICKLCHMGYRAIRFLIHLALWPVYTFSWLLCFGWRKFLRPVQIPRRNRRSARSQARKRHRESLLLIAIIALCLPTCSACTLSSSFQVPTEECVTTLDGEETCTVSISTILSVTPNNKLSCFTFKDDRNRTMGTLRISVPTVKLFCAEKLHFYTREHEIETVAVKRCPRVGQCHGDFCARVDVNSTLQDLPQEAVKYPGYSYCRESCGCAGCGCFFCSPGCMFYRTYARPTSRHTYVSFSCPMFRQQVRVSGNLTLTGQKPFVFYVALKPAQIRTYPNMSFSLLSNSLPPLPILSEHFLQNTLTQQTTLIPPSLVGSPIAGTAGQLQCPSLRKALEFNCTFDPDTCLCYPADENSMKCTCKKINYQEMFKNKEKTLPLKLPGLSIYPYTTGKQGIHASISTSTAVQIQINFKGLKSSLQSFRASCNGTITVFHGCSKCNTGATGTITCFSDFNEVQAELICSTQTFIIPCSRHGTVSTVLYQSRSKDMEKNCLLKCPANQMEIMLKGQLEIMEESIVYSVEAGKVSNIAPTTSPTFASITHEYPELVVELVCVCDVFARMAPDQKQQLVNDLQEVNYTVAMCGDGANDCAALKAAHAGISLSDSEASIAAPFTSKINNISCVPIIIAEGRFALVTSFGMFRYMAGYSLNQVVTVILLYYISNILTDGQFRRHNMR